MKKLSWIILAILFVNMIYAVTYTEEAPEVSEITNHYILGVWEFDSYASQKAAVDEAARKLLKSYDRLRFYFQADGTVEMAGGEVANFSQLSTNKFEIKVDDTTLTFTLSEDKLYAEIPVSKTRTIYPVFTKQKN